MKVIVIAAMLGLGLAATSAQAGCRWVQDCTGGACRQVPLCDSPLDIPPPRPPAISPIPPPSVRPIQPPVVPPVGTSQCSKQYICDKGRCDWQTVCR